MTSLYNKNFHPVFHLSKTITFWRCFFSRSFWVKKETTIVACFDVLRWTKNWILRKKTLHTTLYNGTHSLKTCYSHTKKTEQWESWSFFKSNWTTTLKHCRAAPATQQLKNKNKNIIISKEWEVLREERRKTLLKWSNATACEKSKSSTRVTIKRYILRSVISSNTYWI